MVKGPTHTAPCPSRRPAPGRPARPNLPALDMGDLCKYRDALGRPGEGVHSWRVPPGIAGADLLLTAGVAFLLSRVAFTSYGSVVAFLIVFVILIIAGIALHTIFCVDTALNRYLGLTKSFEGPPRRQ